MPRHGNTDSDSDITVTRHGTSVSVVDCDITMPRHGNIAMTRHVVDSDSGFTMARHGDNITSSTVTDIPINYSEASTGLRRVTAMT